MIFFSFSALWVGNKDRRQCIGSISYLQEVIWLVLLTLFGQIMIVGMGHHGSYISPQTKFNEFSFSLFIIVFCVVIRIFRAPEFIAAFFHQHFNAGGVTYGVTHEASNSYEEISFVVHDSYLYPKLSVKM